MPTSTIATQLGFINTALQGIAVALRVQPFWNTQLFAAVVGAVLGFTPSLYLFYKDRPRIKVKMGPSIFLVSGKARTCIWISISNSGRRPVKVSSAFLKFKDNTTLVFIQESAFVGGSGLPIVLDQNNPSHTVNILVKDIQPEIQKRNSYPVAGCYRDAIDKVYQHKMSKKSWENIFKVAASDEER